MVNIWTVGLVEYFSGVRIVFTGGYVIVHEDHDVLILQAPIPQDLVRMANISLTSRQIYQHTRLLVEMQAGEGKDAGFRDEFYRGIAITWWR